MKYYDGFKWLKNAYFSLPVSGLLFFWGLIGGYFVFLIYFMDARLIVSVTRLAGSCPLAYWHFS